MSYRKKKFLKIFVMRVVAVVVILSAGGFSFAAISDTSVLSQRQARRMKRNAQEHIKKWQNTARNLQNNAASQIKAYKKDAEVLSQQAQDKIEEYKKDVQEIKKQTIKLFKDPSSELSNLNSEFVSSETGKPNIYIFVSSSMNKGNLINLARQAKKHDATLVMRGFVENSHLKTIQYFQKIIEKTGQGIVIDPDLFKTYSVTQVPTFVAVRSEVKHDKLSGNVSLEYAISQMKSKGEAFN